MLLAELVSPGLVGVEAESTKLPLARMLVPHCIVTLAVEPAESEGMVADPIMVELAKKFTVIEVSLKLPRF